METHKELSDEELSSVTGGVIKWAEEGTKIDPSNIVFAFKVGDRVEVYKSNFMFIVFTRRGTIKKRP